MDTFVYHIDGHSDFDTLRVPATDKTHAETLLLSQWLGGKPLVSEGGYKLVHIERIYDATQTRDRRND